MDLKKVVLEELDRLDEMAKYRSAENQAILDELMERDDWEDMLGSRGFKGFPDLTPIQKKVILNYRQFQRKRSDPNWQEKMKQYSAKYRSNPEIQEKIKNYRKEYAKRPESIERKKAYESTPEYREKRAKYERERRNRDIEKYREYQRQRRLRKKENTQI